MRGASALDDVLKTFSGAPIRAVVVWEPVLRTDLAPPFTSVLSLIGDERAAQFWDPQRALSRDIVRAVNADPQRYGVEDPFDEDTIVWDVVAVFDADAHWSEDLPVAAFYDAPVFAVTDDLREALRRALERLEPAR